MGRVTIIIPTYNHGRLLLPAVRSALRQTHQDFEIFIIGDGVTPGTREVVSQAVALDSRIRFIDREKSPRTGEPHRHEVLTTAATGEFVCYLSDDDLWMPDHLAVFCKALETADLVHAIPLFVSGEGMLLSSLVDLSLPEWVNWTLAGNSKNSLSFVGHRMDFYRRLPHGWRTTPAGRSTDNYMWAQMLEMPGIRARCTGEYTLVGFPDLMRKGWSPQRREEELLAWETKIQNHRDEILAGAKRSLALSYYQIEITLHQERDRTQQLAGRVKSLITETRALESQNEQLAAEKHLLSEQAGHLNHRVRELDEQAFRLDKQVQSLTAEKQSLTKDLELWEKRKRVLPGFLRNLLRWYWKRKGL